MSVENRIVIIYDSGYVGHFGYDSRYAGHSGSAIVPCRWPWASSSSCLDSCKLTRIHRYRYRYGTVYRVPLLHPTCIIHYSLSVLYRGWYCGYSTAGMLACCLLLRCRRAICSWTLVLVIERVSSNLKLPLAGGAKVVQLACGGEG